MRNKDLGIILWLINICWIIIAIYWMIDDNFSMISIVLLMAVAIIIIQNLIRNQDDKIIKMQLELIRNMMETLNRYATTVNLLTKLNRKLNNQMQRRKK